MRSEKVLPLILFHPSICNIIREIETRRKAKTESKGLGHISERQEDEELNFPCGVFLLGH